MYKISYTFTLNCNSLKIINLELIKSFDFYSINNFLNFKLTKFIFFFIQ